MRKVLVLCAMLMLYATTVYADITSNRVLYLRLNEGTGGASTALADLGTGAHTCALDATNFPDWLSGASCKQGACLLFNGTDDRASCDDATDLSATNGTNDTPLSLVGWFYLFNIATGEGSLIARSSNGFYEYQLWISGSVLYMQLHHSDGAATIGRSAPLTTGAHQNQWIHIAATYAGTELATGIKIYINGTRVDTGPDVNNGTYTGMANTTALLEFGIYAGGAAGPLNARMDELKIFARELTASDVVEDMNAITAVPTRKRMMLY
jgi:hypothetical protein